jgi:flagellar hook-basal body complex protein FliE
MAIDPLSGPSAAGALSPVAPGTASTSGKPGFADALQDLLTSVDGSAGDANEAVGRMLDGSGDVHEAMIALQRADVMLQMTVQVRNKLVQAYQDIMRMPV